MMQIVLGWVILGVVAGVVLVLVILGKLMANGTSVAAVDQPGEPLVVELEAPGKDWPPGSPGDIAGPGDGLVDLRALPSVRVHVAGSGHYLTESQRRRYGGVEYELRREPSNPHDPLAVAVYGHGKKVGYVPAGRAGMLAPLLDQLGARGYLVRGAGTTESSIVLHVEVPRVPELRRMVTASQMPPKG